MATTFPPQPSENQDPWYNAAKSWSEAVEAAINLRLVTSRGYLPRDTDLSTLSTADDSGFYRLYTDGNYPNLPPEVSKQVAGLLVFNSQVTRFQLYVGFETMSWRQAPLGLFGGWRNVISSENVEQPTKIFNTTDVPGENIDNLPNGRYAIQYLKTARALGLPSRVGVLTVTNLTQSNSGDNPLKLQKYETNHGDIDGNGNVLPWELYVRGMDYQRNYYPTFTKVLSSNGSSGEGGMLGVSQTIFAEQARGTYTSSMDMYKKNSSTIDSPASTTKVFTGWLARKYITNAMLDDQVTVLDTDKNPGGSGSEIPLRVGDIITIRDLFYLTMLPSHNQAASILARVAGEKIPGSGDPYDRFVNQMQTESDGLGWTGAIWANPTGLGTTANKTSVDYQIDLLYKVATDQFMLDCMGTQTYVMDVAGPQARTISTKHSVDFDGEVKFPDAVAAKSGTIPGTACLVMLFRKSNGTLGAAALFKSNTENRYKDMRQLINYTLEQRDKQYLVG